MSAEVEFTDNSLKIKNLIEENIEAFLEEVGGELESQTQRNTRVDTGKTKGSWEHVVNLSNKEVIIGNPLQNAIWEEFGTGEYALKGDGRKGGWVYKSPKTGEFYHTRGKTPSRALYKAFNSKKETIKRRAKQILEGID